MKTVGYRLNLAILSHQIYDLAKSSTVWFIRMIIHILRYFPSDILRYIHEATLHHVTVEAIIVVVGGHIIENILVDATLEGVSSGSVIIFGWGGVAGLVGGLVGLSWGLFER